MTNTSDESTKNQAAADALMDMANELSDASASLEERLRGFKV
jgi:hypothetical protein